MQKSRKIEITKSNYARYASKTCLPQCMQLAYLIPGFTSEFYEFMGKVDGALAKQVREEGAIIPKKRIDAIKDEAGDIFWFIALICLDCKITFAKVYDEAVTVFKDKQRSSFAAAGCVLSMNGTMMDRPLFVQSKIKHFANKTTKEKKDELVALLAHTLVVLKSMGITKFESIMQSNIDKLASRQQRNQIQGDGDKR